MDGNIWENVEDGKVFQGNLDHNTKVRNNFSNPVHARAIRIYPVSWNNHISLRFDAIYQE